MDTDDKKTRDKPQPRRLSPEFYKWARSMPPLESGYMAGGPMPKPRTRKAVK